MADDQPKLGPLFPDPNQLKYLDAHPLVCADLQKAPGPSTLIRMNDEIIRLARQLGLDLDLLSREISWAMGEMRINLVTPAEEEFVKWTQRRDGLFQFWAVANARLCVPLDQEEAVDIWRCLELTFTRRKRKPLGFGDYLTIAMSSEQICEYCGRRPPEAKLDIDHILPVSRGGTNVWYNLRFLCVHCNRSRGNRFHWADIWRRV